MVRTESVYFDAAGFIEDVRHVRRESGRRLSGAFWLDDSQLKGIIKVSLELCIDKRGDVVTSGHAISLLKRFEEICRRQKRPFPNEHRSSILNCLISELKINFQTLGGESPENLIPTTVCNGAIGPALLKHKSFFTESEILAAARDRAADPEGFLQTVHRQVEEFKTRPELSDFRDTPWLYKFAATRYTKSPRLYLLNLQRHNRELIEESQKNENEFFCFSKNTWIFRYALIGHPANPESFLRKVKKKSEALIKASQKPSSKFHQYSKTPELIVLAVATRPVNPEAYLLDTKRMKELLLLETQRAGSDLSFFAKRPWVTNYAVARGLKDPLNFLITAKERSERLIRESQNPDNELHALAQKPATILKAVVTRPESYEKHLRKVVAPE